MKGPSGASLPFDPAEPVHPKWFRGREIQEKWGRHVALFSLTLLTTTFVGVSYAQNFRSSTPPAGPLGTVGFLSLLATGLVYSVPLMAILFAHEMGHYLYCRHYGVDASPPYFIPFPFVLGTFGAFIRIREPFRSKRELFDMGVAGPIAGFVVTIPVLAYGILHTRPLLVSDAPAEGFTTFFGYPLGVTLLQKLLLGHTFDTAGVREHPAFVAGWAGLLVTALNLLPLGQLDGGHAVYALLGPRHRALFLPLVTALLVLGFHYPGWWVWAAVLVLLGRRHPPVPDEFTPLDTRRKAVLALVAVIFALSFHPVPLREERSGGTVPRRPEEERGGTVVHKLDLHRGAEDARLHPNSEPAKRVHVTVE